VTMSKGLASQCVRMQAALVYANMLFISGQCRIVLVDRGGFDEVYSA
jgi:hypothetical protein